MKSTKEAYMTQHDNRNDNRDFPSANRGGMNRQTMAMIAVAAVIVLGILAYYLSNQNRSMSNAPGTTTSTPGTTTSTPAPNAGKK